MFNENKYGAKILRFNWGKDEDFRLWSLCLKAALQSRELASGLAKDSLEDNANERTMTIMISALGDNPLQAVQNCLTAMAM